MSRFAKLRAELRQRRHHRAFRIPPPVADEDLREQVARLLARVRETPADEHPVTPRAPSTPEPSAHTPATPEPARAAGAEPLDEKLLADAATHLWRAQRRLTRAGEASTARDRQAGRLLTTSRDALADAGVVIQDHDGDPFHSGRSIEVLVFETDPTLTAEVVLETVRPTVYLHGRRIQMGQVIVAGPPADDQGPPAQPGDQTGDHHE
ncbi:hypothetical protein [Saccharothrix australiensis]|uniref:Uncharacterized protein n=1 Tax=Saccharothrix australiensis TaxID=2072 RepID=A0A495W0N6_9PSEU|nr:hypothetical protein [Saccharothrix australiensis]RKT55176.1 hypothetical protein C8E97_3834 [Saccharothrix australiensis]